MLFVTGTKRSGTTMWIQVLRAAGFPILGEALPRGFSPALHEKAPEGYYEALLRDGVYFRTNPHPLTDEYFLPEQVEGYVVKVSVAGLIRSERAYVSHLLANVRDWREYEASLLRLRAEEREALARSGRPVPRDSSPIPAAYEWWTENFALLRDIHLRRYPARLQTYEQILERPEQVLSDVLAWLGRGDLAAAVPAITPAYRPQTRPDSGSVAPRLARAFDDLYAAVAAGKPFPTALLRDLAATNRAIQQEIEQLKRKARPPRPPPPAPAAGLPRLG